MNASRAQPLIGVLMGSDSDWETMQHACDVLKEFAIAFEAKVVSAHRTPDEMFAYAEAARERGIRMIIAGAGGAAHLPGMLASKSVIPVLGVPVPSKYLRGEDSLLSIVQMPKGVPGCAVCSVRSGRDRSRAGPEARAVPGHPEREGAQHDAPAVKAPLLGEPGRARGGGGGVSRSTWRALQGAPWNRRGPFAADPPAFLPQAIVFPKLDLSTIDLRWL